MHHFFCNFSVSSKCYCLFHLFRWIVYCAILKVIMMRNLNHHKKKKNHYIYFHLINKDNYFFKELCSIDNANRYSRRCEECKISFSSCRKKNHCFLSHYSQSVGSNNLILNISKRSLITYHSIKGVYTLPTEPLTFTERH